MPPAPSEQHVRYKKGLSRKGLLLWDRVMLMDWTAWQGAVLSRPHVGGASIRDRQVGSVASYHCVKRLCPPPRRARVQGRPGLVLPQGWGHATHLHGCLERVLPTLRAGPYQYRAGAVGGQSPGEEETASGPQPGGQLCGHGC